MSNGSLAIKDANIEPMTEADTWPTPDMSVLSIGKHTPRLPIERFGSWADWLKTRAKESTAPLDYVAFAFLTVAGGLLGNRRWVQPRPRWIEPPVIWTILVGDPSYKKSPALDCVTEIVDTLEKELTPDWEDEFKTFKADLALAAANKDVWLADIKKAAKDGKSAPHMPDNAEEPICPVEPIFRTADATAAGLIRLLKDRPEGILLCRDELSGWVENLSAYNANDGAFFIEGYGGRAYRQTRASKESFSGKIDRVSISILGGIQPEKLKPLLLSRANDGMASRFFMIWPERPAFGFSDGTTNPLKAVNALRKITRLRMKITETGLEPENIPFDTTAFKIFEEWSRENYGRISGAHGKFKGFLGKLDGMVARLALILEFLEWAASDESIPPQTIGDRAVTNALYLVDDYLVPMTEKAYGAAALSVPEMYAHELLNHIFNNKVKTFNARDWYRHPPVQGMSTTQSIYAGIGVLEDWGIVREAVIEPGGKGGRPRKDFIVNPKLWRAL